MPKDKKVETKPVRKRIRRGPEVLIKELERKMKKLEERVFKKNKEAVHEIGVAILKRARFDFSAFTDSDLEEIKKMTPKGAKLISEIIEQAREGYPLA